MNKHELAAILATDEGSKEAARTLTELAAEPMAKLAAALCTMLVARCMAANGKLDFDWMRREAPEFVARFSGEALLPFVIEGFDKAADKITDYTEGLK